MSLTNLRKCSRYEAQHRIFGRLSRGLSEETIDLMRERWAPLQLRGDVREIPGDVWRALCNRNPGPVHVEAIAAFSYLNNFRPQLFGRILQLRVSHELLRHYYVLIMSWDDSSDCWELREPVVAYSLELGHHLNLNGKDAWDAPSECKENESPPHGFVFENRGRQIANEMNRQMEVTD